MLTDFVAFDIEEPNQHTHAISAIGVTIVRGGKIQARYHTLINPETTFDSYVIKLTGITPAMVAGKPTIEELWPKLEKLLFSGSVLVAHGAACDLMNLVLALDRYHIEVDTDIRYICTADLSRILSPQAARHSLSVLCEEFGIALNAHNAQSDSDGCAQLLLKYISSGYDCESYIRHDNTYSIAERQRVNEFARKIKNTQAASLKRNKKRGKLSPFSSKKLESQIETLAQEENLEKHPHQIIRDGVFEFGLTDKQLWKMAREMQPTVREAIINSAYFEFVDYYRLYVRCMKYVEPSAKLFIRLLTFLPSYTALDGIDCYDALDVLEEGYTRDLEVVETLMVKSVGFGCHAFAMRLILLMNLASTDPEYLLNVMRRTVNFAHKYFKDEVFKEKYFEIWGQLIEEKAVTLAQIKKIFARNTLINDEFKRRFGG